MIQSDERFTPEITILELSNTAYGDQARATLHVELQFDRKSRRHGRWAV